MKISLEVTEQALAVLKELGKLHSLSEDKVAEILILESTSEEVKRAFPPT